MGNNEKIFVINDFKYVVDIWVYIYLNLNSLFMFEVWFKYKYIFDVTWIEFTIQLNYREFMN